MAIGRRAPFIYLIIHLPYVVCQLTPCIYVFIPQGVRFDPDLPQTLRLEFAKSNTKVTKPKQASPMPAAQQPTLIHPITGRE